MDYFGRCIGGHVALHQCPSCGAPVESHAVGATRWRWACLACGRCGYPTYRRAADVPRDDLRSQTRWRALGRRLLPGATPAAYVEGWPSGAALYPISATEPIPPTEIPL